MALTIEEFKEALKKAKTSEDFNNLAMEIPPRKGLNITKFKLKHERGKDKG